MRSSSGKARVVLVGGLVLVLIGGFVAYAKRGSVHRYRFWLEAWFRSDPDYDAIDAERGVATAFDTAERSPGAEAPAAYWTQYRGPHGDGVYDERELSLNWPSGEGPARAWSVPVGPAYSSIVVAGGLAITMEQRREREAIVAFAFDSGAPIWEHAWDARFHEPLSKEGPRGTPAIDGQSVVAMGATGELRCVELATGVLRWRRSLGEGNLRYGLAGSPRIRDGVVYAQGATSVQAFELATGEPRWTALDEQLAYATLQFGTLLDVETLLVCAATRVVGLELATGRELWSFPWEVNDQLTCTQPVVIAPNRVMVSAGYGKGAEMVELAPEGDGVAATSLWRSSRFKTRFNEPVVSGEHAYGFDEGILACIELASGRRVWKGGRYGYGQLLLVGEQLLVVDEEGDVHVIPAVPEEREVTASFEGIGGEMTINVPALAHGFLYLRNDRELACFELR